MRGLLAAVSGYSGGVVPGVLALTFGALTRANAGGALPVDGDFGVTTLTPTAAVITNADPVNPSHWGIVGGNKLAPTINGGLAASYTLTVAYDGAPVTVTITTLAGVYSAASTAEIGSALTHAATTPTQSLEVKVRSGTYGALTVSSIAMSGTLTGVPPAPACFNTPDAYRAQTWTPDFTGGRVRISSHKPFGAKFNGGSTHASSTAIVYGDLVFGRLNPTPQYFYEPEHNPSAPILITGMTLGNPTQVTIQNAALVVVGALCRVSGITAGPTQMNGVHLPVLAVSGNTVTLNYDSTGLTPWTAGGNFAGASSTGNLNAWECSGASSTFVIDKTRFSCRDFNPDAAYWVNLIKQSPYKHGVFNAVEFDGYYTAMSVGQGWMTWLKDIKGRNALTDNLAFRTTDSSVAATHTAIAKTITGITQSVIGVVTCPSHGMAVDDTFVISGVTGMTQANNGSGQPQSWAVYAVIDANSFQLGMLPSTGADAVVPVNTTAWSAYVSGGAMNGPLFSHLFAENVYFGPQAGDPRFSATHSDGAQMGSPNNEIRTKGALFDTVLHLSTATTATNATQGVFLAGAETDGTKKAVRISNVLSICTSQNAVMSATSNDWEYSADFVTALRWPTTLSPSLPATYRSPGRKNLARGVIAGQWVNNGGGIMTGSKVNLMPNDDFSAVFAGNFAPDGRGYYYDQDPEPSGTAAQIIAAYGARYKGIGVCANMGFGADPVSPFFTGTADNAPAGLSGLSFTPNAYNIAVNWSCNQGAGFAYWILSTSGTLNEGQAIAAAKAAETGVLGTGIVGGRIIGINASGAQPVINPQSLTPSTAYFFYLVVERVQGARTFTGAQAVSTTAVSGVPVQQTVLLHKTSTSYTAQNALPTQITIGTGANRAMIVALTFMVISDTADSTGISFTFGAPGRALGTGTVMTVLGQIHGAGPKRARTIIAALLNPPSGAGTVQVMAPGAVPQSAVAWAIEVANAKQSLANWIIGAGAGGTANVTARSSAITSAAANSLHVGAATVYSGNWASEFAASNAATLAAAEGTGSSSFSDHSAALLTKAVPAVGADTIGVTWATAQIASILDVMVPPEV